MPNYSDEETRTLTKEMSDKIYNDSYSTTEEELKTDTNWIEATKSVYKELEGVEWSGADEDAAKTGLDLMSRFNYNLTLGTINYTAKLQDADPKTKLAFYYMMDMYDKKDISGNGVMRAFKEMGLDAASYIGIGTLGMGFAGKQAATVAAKTSLKAMLKQGAIKFLQSPTAVAATEGAIYTGVDDIARQDAAIGAGVQDEYSPGQTALATGIGAAAGAGIVKGTQAIGRKVSGWAAAEEAALRKNFDEGGSMAGGGTPPEVDYRMEHTSPGPEGANSGSDLTDIYPDSPNDRNFERYYGTGDKISDQESIQVMKQMENNPDAEVTIYRAAPEGTTINEGDWITLSKNYATEHGEAHLDGNYVILEQKVKAKDVFTNGDSINEWGYYPQDTTNKVQQLDPIEIKPNDKEEITLYRGVNEDNTGTGEALIGKGLYLTPSETTAKSYGSKVEKVTIQNDKLFDATKEITDTEYKEFLSLFKGQKGIEYMPDENIKYTYEFLKDDIGANTGMDYEEVAEKMNSLIKKKNYEGIFFDLSQVNDSVKEGEKAFLLFPKGDSK